MIKKRYALFALICATLVNTGCVSLALTGAATGAYVVSDRRYTESVILDEGIEWRISSRLHRIFPKAHINVSVYNSIVLLTGEIESEQKVQECTKIARQIEHVRNVINRLEVKPRSGLESRLIDTELTAQVKAQILRQTQHVSINAVRVVTEARTVYLMGLLKPEELPYLLSAVKKVSGITKVVNLFEYITPKYNYKKK